MSRLFRSFVAEVGRSGGGRLRAAALAERFEAYVANGSLAAPNDLAAVASFIAKRPSEATEYLAAAGVPLSDSIIGLLMHRVGLVALPRLGSFTPAAATELLHALSSNPTATLRDRLEQASDVVQGQIALLDGRGLALLANAYARMQLRDKGVLRKIARRGVVIMSTADGQAAAGLAHSFAKLQTYHKALFVALQERLLELSQGLPAAEVARCLFAFAQSLPPAGKEDPMSFAFDRTRGFGRIVDALVARAKALPVDSDGTARPTNLLMLRSMSILQIRDEPLLIRLLSGMNWTYLTPHEQCTVLQAVARLEMGALAQPVDLNALRGLAVARGGSLLCVLVGPLALLRYGSHGRCAWAWNPPMMSAWTRLLGGASAAALPPASLETHAKNGSWGGADGTHDVERSAAPHVPLACLALLPPFADRFGAHLAMQDAWRMLQFTRHIHSAARTQAVRDTLATTALQVSVEVSLRALLLADGVSLHVDDEVRAPPFFIDIVAA